MFLHEIKNRASSFLHEKYKSARLVFTDVTQAELLAEEATNNDPCSPDARTMTRIAQASFDIDDYWRIVDILHRRFYSIDWKQWRQSYKSMVLLDFLITHGPEEFAEEFKRDYVVIQELGTFKHKDNNGFDWGMSMQKKSTRILELLHGGETLKQARLKALRISKEIQGFGNLMSSPSSSSSSFGTSGASSFGSYSTSSPSWCEIVETTKNDQHSITKKPIERVSHVWEEPPIDEIGSLLDSGDEEKEKEEEKDEKTYGFISGICSKLVSVSPSKNINCEKVAFRSLSDVGIVMRKKTNHRFSKEY